MMKRFNLCFGRAAMFVPTSARCKGCNEGVDCATEVMRRLIIISEQFDTSDLQRRAQTYLDRRGAKRKAPVTVKPGTKMRFAAAAPVSFDPPFSVSTLAQKPRKLATAITKLGIDMSLDAQNHTNSFPVDFRPSYMSQVQELLNGGGFTRAELRQVICSDRVMSEQALHNATSTVITALTALGVIFKQGDSYAPH